MSRRRGAVVSPKDDWQTPKWLLDALRAELGPIGLDPCTTPENPTQANHYLCLGGLDADWRRLSAGSWAFVNPPFSQAHEWATKATVATLDGAEIALLLPASVNSRRFRFLAAVCDALAFFRRRVSYVDPATGEEMRGADFDSACWYFGPRKFDFARALRSHAVVVIHGHGFAAQEGT